jgi:hypothetical protein
MYKLVTSLALIVLLSINKIYAQWTTDVNTSSVSLSNTTYNVGIGIQPAEKLHINGAIRGNSTAGALRVSTVNGYVDLGPQNATYSHFTTDRSGFYFSNPVFLGNGILSSNTSTDLKLQAGGITRLTIANASSNIGLGIDVPMAKLHVLGELLLEANAPMIYTGKLSTDENKYLHIANSPLLATPSGLKASGILVADANNYADPAKNNLVVKGVVGIGNTLTSNPNGYSLLVNGKVNASSFYINDQIVVSSQWTTSNANVYFNGGVGIGTTLSDNPNNYKLAVNGKIGAKDVRVETNSTTWPDYVFESGYTLPTLRQLEIYINENKHLPDVPSAQQIEKEGHELGEMDAILMKKIEELTLYMIDLEKENEELKKRLESVEKGVNK